MGPSLPDKDASGVDLLPGITLDAPSLTVTVSSVPGAAACFFM